MERSKEMFQQIQEECLFVKEQVFNGELSNLEGLIKLRKAKQEAETVLEIVKSFEDERLQEISNEAEQYGGKWNGYEIKSVNGRKMYSFKGIPEIEEVNKKLSETQEKHKSAFEGFQKGTVQTTEEEGVRYWIDNDGQLNPFPEVNIGKSYLTVKQLKK